MAPPVACVPWDNPALGYIVHFLPFCCDGLCIRWPRLSLASRGITLLLGTQFSFFTTNINLFFQRYGSSALFPVPLNHLSWMLLTKTGRKFSQRQSYMILSKGGPLECKDFEELQRYYLELRGVKTSTEVFKYARSIEINDPSTVFAIWFFGTIFDGSDIVAKGTEVSSEANAHAINSSRQLSSITAISNRKMGRREDTIFKYGSEERWR
ncbi:hypothetical protein BDC45DRAFT_536780 [Circinella umbellata]|nr:hypothetical protein BDC45DRAFT_536780 [Circinella umbellata]